MDRDHIYWNNTVEHAALSDVGLRRANNQDSVAVALAGSRQKWLQRGHLFMVADGMGAHAAGELASKIATDVVPLTYHKMTESPPPEALVAAVRDANSQIFSRGQANDDFKGMGTTVCALALTPQGALLAHVGDSRAYRVRDGRIEQLTFDHSLVWEMQRAGQLPRGEPPGFIPRNIITRSLGPHEEVEVDVEGPFPLHAGDTFVLCSDGLSGPVEDDEIGKVVSCMPPEEATRALVDLANLRGGPDNVSVVVVRVVEEPAVPQVDQSEPPERRSGRRPVHPLVFGVMGVLGLGALVFGSTGYWPAAVVSLVGALVAAGVALVQAYGGGLVHYRYDDRLRGGAPYAAVACRPDAVFCETLRQIVDDLREAAAHEDWTVDWSRFNSHSAEAVKAADCGDHCRAVLEYCQAVSFMMKELKAQRRSKRKSNGASAIDLP